MTLKILNTLNPTGLSNIIFYPCFTIVASYCIAFLLFLINPKNRNVYIFISVPIAVSIICVSVNGLYQLGSILDTGKITDSLRLFQMFVLFIGMLILCGTITEFKIKYTLVSYVIAIILHAYFYYYCSKNGASIIYGVLDPTFEYLVALVLAYFFTSHLTLPNYITMASVRTPFLDPFMPVNEKNSHKTIVLLLAHSMIIHTNFMVFMRSSTFDDYWTFYAIALFVVLLQLIIVIMCLRIMHIYPTSANTPFYVSAYVMIIKTLMESIYTNIESYIQNKPFNKQSQYFSNKLLYLFVYILVIFILNCEVALAVDESEEPGPSSPVSESNVFHRISQSGWSKLFVYAGFYEGVSAVREWLQEQVGLGSEKEAFLTAVEDCHTAKTNLENIPKNLAKYA